MQSHQRETIDKFIVELKRDVIPMDALPYLPCLTDDDREVVQHRQDREGPRSAVPILLERLKKRSNSFEQLLQALEHSGCRHLKKLLNTVTRSPQTEHGVATASEETSPGFKSQLSIPSQETDFSEFDMLVCYGQNDKEIAYEMKDIMDKEYNLRVCIDEKDFIPGKAISENICEFIRCSKTIVFLLSEDFLEKKWAHWEIQHALLDSLDKKKSSDRKKIIPILLKKCEVPNALQPYTPLNFQESRDWKRLAAAVQEEHGADMVDGTTSPSSSGLTEAAQESENDTSNETPTNI